MPATMHSSSKDDSDGVGGVYMSILVGPQGPDESKGSLKNLRLNLLQGPDEGVRTFRSNIG